MSLINTIKEDQLTARKARDARRASFLTTLYSEAAMVGKNDGGRETTDDEVIAVLKKFEKNLVETITYIDEEDIRYAVATNEMKYVIEYLPQQLSEDELRGIITEMVQGKTIRDMGSIMKDLKEEYTGLFDGRLASTIVKELLQ